jgi:tripartite-type tricarboxylate transporter receptor subunit TctC
MKKYFKPSIVAGTIWLCSTLAMNPAQAQLPDNFTVVTSQPPGGIIDTTCRKVFEIYNRIHNTNSVTLNKVGGNGAVAEREVVANTKFTVGCASGAEHWASPIMFSMPDADKVRIVTQIVAIPDFYYTSTNNSAKTFTDLLENYKQHNTPISIGGFSGHIARMEFVLKKYNVKSTAVPYQKMTDMVPSLMDQTLNLSIDGGTLLPLAQENKIKVLGYISRRDLPNIDAKNYYKQYQDLGPMLPTMALYVSKAISDDQFDEFAKRTISIIRSEEFHQWAMPKNFTPLGESPKQAEEVIEKARQLFSNSQKK